MTTTTGGELILITASSRGVELQKVLQDSLQASVCVTNTFEEAASAISLARCRAVIVDDALADLDPANAKRLLSRLKHQLPIFVNLAISDIPRCVREVQLALCRFAFEQEAALLSVGAQVHDSLTSVLVRSQLAIDVPDLPAIAIKHIKGVIQAAKTMQCRLDPKSFRVQKPLLKS